jgi:hypothetical protein
MKLYNTIVIYDVYTIANSSETARKAVMQFIQAGDIQPSESTALETRAENNIRSSWRDQKPLVGEDITDDDFDKRVKGHTTIEMFQHIYLKR